MSQIMDIVFDAEYEIKKVLNELPNVSASQLGLDSRAGYSIWVDEDMLIVTKATDRTLQYYGGFEYVDSECRTTIGNYVLYCADSSRVSDCIAHYEETFEAA